MTRVVVERPEGPEDATTPVETVLVLHFSQRWPVGFRGGRSLWLVGTAYSHKIPSTIPT